MFSKIPSAFVQGCAFFFSRLSFFMTIDRYDVFFVLLFRWAPVTIYGSIAATVHTYAPRSTVRVGTLCKGDDSNRRDVLRVGGYDEVRYGPALDQMYDKDTENCHRGRRDFENGTC